MGTTSFGSDGSARPTVSVIGLVQALASLGRLTDPLLHVAHSALAACASAIDGVRGDVVQQSGGRAADQLDLRPSAEPSIVLQSDADLCVLFKPPGWTVSVANDDGGPPPKSSRKGELAIQEWIAQGPGAYCPIAQDPSVSYGLLHRLDRETSGALVWAKSYTGYYAARLCFIARQVRKQYVCLCCGWAPLGPRLLDLPLVEVLPQDGPPRTEVNANSEGTGRPALTELVAVGHFVYADGLPSLQRVSIVEILLHTGRQHQIRAHLAHEGFPLVGDPKYGGERAAVVWATRVYLHASRLGLRPGAHNSVSDARVPLPPDLRQALQRLRPLSRDGGSLLAAWLQL